jgi:hypothetical protein
MIMEYMRRERDLKREKKKLNREGEKKNEIIRKSLFCRPYYFVNNLLLI